jgi:multidrug efflux system outer membrane protein
MRDRQLVLNVAIARALRLAPASALLLAVSACVVGPDYKRPAVTLDAGFVAAGASSVNAQPAPADIARFWRGFNDAALTALIDRALAANGDVRIAQARLQEARANLGVAEAEGLPAAGVTGDAKRATRPITQQPGASRSARTGNTFDASFVANWELDLFGRFKRGSESAAALVDAGTASVHAAQTSVAAEVARNYLELRGLQLRQQLTQASLVNLRDALRITSARFDAGRGTQLDLLRSRVLVASTEATLPTLQTAIERAAFRIATLCARPPRELLAELAPPASSTALAGLPSLPVTDLSSLPVGTPEQWLQRRPDVIAAERQLAATSASIGVAKADLFPRISLSGLLGFNAATLGSLLKTESAIYSLGAGLTWTPFDAGSTRGRIRASEARNQQSLATYEQTVATALEETEGAFSSFTRSAQRAEQLALATRDAQEAARLARARFNAGVTDFTAVLDAERDVLSNQDGLVQAQVGVATALVTVYRALGGGWDAATVATPMAAAR